MRNIALAKLTPCEIDLYFNFERMDADHEACLRPARKSNQKNEGGGKAYIPDCTGRVR